MKTFPFQKLLASQPDLLDRLPEEPRALLRARIDFFNEMLTQHQKLPEEEKKPKWQQIEDFALELEEDLEELFEEELDNNDAPTSPLGGTEGDGGDEQIIQELYRKGTRRITPQQLQQAGVKTPLTKRVHRIGSCSLSRPRYESAYLIRIN